MPVNVVGIDDVLKGLTFIDKDMRERIRAAIDPLMRNVATKAKGYVAANGAVLSGWSKPVTGAVNYRPFPKYDAATVKAGIGYNPGENKTFKNGFKVSNYVYNVSAAGRIYETAGRLNAEGRAPVMSTTLKELGSVQGYAGSRGGKKRSTRDYNSNNPFAGYQFVTALEKVTSQPKLAGVRTGGRKSKGRLIYKAFAADSGKVYEAIVQAINASAITFNKATEIKKTPSFSGPGISAYQKAA